MADQRTNSEAIDLDLYEAVFAALTGYRPGALVSTQTAIADARKRLPRHSEISNDELVNLIVNVATTSQMRITFDDA